MAGYTRQATFTTGNVVSASDFTNEFDELLSAFSNTSGHAHDGTAAEGPVIGLIGDAGVATPLNKIVVDTSNNRVGVFVNVSSAAVEQVRIQDGAIVPVTDSDVDLGTSSLRFKDLHIDSIAMLTSTVTDILDEDDMTSDSATALATQQSIKAYVDANSGGGGGSSTFAGLTDTPSSLSSDGGKMVKVNSGGTALEFVTANTTAITEGTNLYHTTARARAAVSVTSNAASGNGSLTYSDSTGVFTFTPADVSSGGSGSVDYAAVEDSVTTAPSASGTSAIALGYLTTSTGTESIAIGHGADATNAGSIAIGGDSTSNSFFSVAIGDTALADQNYSVAIGYQANTSAVNQLMLGSTSASTGFTSIRVGNTSYTPSDNYDLTTKTYVDSKISTDISAANTFIASNGTATAGGADDLAIGPGANTNGATEAIAIGKGAEAKLSSSTYGVAVGSSSSVGGNAVAVGYQADAADESVAVGEQADASGSRSVALGLLAEATHNNSTAIGYSAASAAANQLMLGDASSSGFTSVRVGNTSYAPSNNLDLTPKNYVDTQVAAKAALTDLSVTTASASGGGALAYNNSTGLFTFTPSTSGNRTFVRFSRYEPSPATVFNIDNDFSSATYTNSRFMTNQTPVRADNSGTGLSVAATGGVEETSYSGGAGTDIGGATKVISITNNSGATIDLTTSGQIQVRLKLTNNGGTSASNAPYIYINSYVNNSQWAIGALGVTGSGTTGAAVTQLAGNAPSDTYTFTYTSPNNRSWADGQDLDIEFTANVLTGQLSSAMTNFDMDIDIADITIMYNAAVTTYDAVSTNTDGVKLTFNSSSSTGYTTLNSSPQTGDDIVGFYEGSSASTDPTDYEWSIYAGLPSTTLKSGDVLQYGPGTGWQYRSLDLSPTSFSKFAAATKYVSSSTFQDIGTLMALNDGHQGVGEALVSITRGSYVQAFKVTFVLTSSGVDFTSYSAIQSGASQFGFINVAFDSSNGGTAKLQGKVVSGYPCTFTFHVTQL